MNKPKPKTTENEKGIPLHNLQQHLRIQEQTIRDEYNELIERDYIKKSDVIEWLGNLIEVSELCLNYKKSSDEYDKLVFQLKSKLKELDNHTHVEKELHITSSEAVSRSMREANTHAVATDASVNHTAEVNNKRLDMRVGRKPVRSVSEDKSILTSASQELREPNQNKDKGGRK